MEDGGEVMLCLERSLLNASERAAESSSGRWARQLSFVVGGPLCFGLIWLGVASNLASLFVFSRSRRQPCIYHYLKALAVWDICLLVGGACLFSGPVLFLGPTRHVGAMARAYPFLYVAANAALMGPVWVTMALTLDRYSALCHPFWHLRRLGSESATLRLLGAASAFALLYSLPRFFALQVLPCWDERSSQWSWVVQQSRLSQSWAFKWLYKVLGGLAFYSLGPFVLLLGLTGRIVLAMHGVFASRLDLSGAEASESDSLRPRSRDSRKVSRDQRPLFRCQDRQSRRSRQENRRTNLMLVGLICKFLLSHVAPTLLDCLENVSLVPSPLLFGCLVDLSNLIVVLNASSNFLLYLVGSRGFRQECRRSLLCAAGLRRRRDSRRVLAKAASSSLALSKPSIVLHNHSRPSFPNS